MNYNYRKNKLGIIIDDNDDEDIILFNSSIVINKSKIHTDKYFYKRIIKFKNFGIQIVKKGIYI
jgi:hypothetical protein